MYYKEISVISQSNYLCTTIIILKEDLTLTTCSRIVHIMNIGSTPLVYVFQNTGFVFFCVLRNKMYTVFSSLVFLGTGFLNALLREVFTVFSPIWLRSSPFISENWTFCGLALTEICRIVSPSTLLMEMVLSSLARASRFSLLHDPLVIRRVCFPRIGTFLSHTKIKHI